MSKIFDFLGIALITIGLSIYSDSAWSALIAGVMAITGGYTIMLADRIRKGASCLSLAEIKAKLGVE